MKKQDLSSSSSASSSSSSSSSFSCSCSSFCFLRFFFLFFFRSFDAADAAVVASDASLGLVHRLDRNEHDARRPTLKDYRQSIFRYAPVASTAPVARPGSILVPVS